MRARAERQQPLLRLGERVRLQPADFAQRDFPVRESGVGQEGVEGGVVDGLDLRRDKRGGLGDFGEQVLRIAPARFRFAASELSSDIRSEA